jgi:Tfp pilus assembly protein PilV
VHAGDQDGFMLVEVLISAMIVALMAVATVTGFTALNKTGAEERHRNEAAVLAAESQESMRSDPVTTLLSFKEEGGNTYTAKVAGTKYTIVQKASFGNGSEATGCSATESTKGQGTYVRISSTVTWTHMVVKPVTEASIITPPTGSALDVEASNGQTPTAGVPVIVKYVPSGGTTTSSLEGTTSSSGCVLFAGIPATEATVEVEETAGIVNRHGTQSWPTATVTLAPNVLTRDQLTLAHAGSVTAEFTYRGLNKDVHSNNAGTGNYEEPVTGDTFVVYNAEMELPPNWQEGSTTAPEPFSGALFEILPAKLTSGYQQTAPSPKETTRYPNGDLFPFPSPKNWTAWAGDCLANKPEPYDSSVTAEAKTVPPGGPVTIKVPTTYVMLNVYAATEAEVSAKSKKSEPTWTALDTTESKPVTTTNKKCEGVTAPDNETSVNVKHVQATTTGTEWGGHLSAPFQPFGEYELCLAGENGKVYRPKSQPYTNTNPEKPVTLNIYLNELSHSEIKTTRETKEKETQSTRVSKEKETQTAREASESATKAARVTAETEAKTKREAKEKETKTKRETTEAASGKEREKEETAQKETKTKEETTKKERETKESGERKTWEEEEKSKKITHAERLKKEETQTKNRATSETTEKKAKENRESEEKATKKKREEEAAAKKAAETKELEEKTKAEAKETETRKTEETKETATRVAAEAKEGEARKTEETKEAKVTSEEVKTEETALAAREDIIESGTSC